MVYHQKSSRNKFNSVLRSSLSPNCCILYKEEKKVGWRGCNTEQQQYRGGGYNEYARESRTLHKLTLKHKQIAERTLY